MDSADGPGTGEAHLVIESMRKVTITGSFAGSRHGVMAGGQGGHMHWANRINHGRRGTKQERQAQ